MAWENVFNSKCFLSAVSAGKKHPKQVRKMPEIKKKFNLEVVMTFFGKLLEKYWHNPQIFKSRYRSRNSSLESQIL